MPKPVLGRGRCSSELQERLQTGPAAGGSVGRACLGPNRRLFRQASGLPSSTDAEMRWICAREAVD
jgi:hypothetical protein